MLVVGQRDEFRTEQALLRDELHLACVSDEFRCEKHGHVPDVFSSITSGVLPLHVGVDRHLRDAASTNGVDEVDGGGAALRTNDVQR